VTRPERGQVTAFVVIFTTALVFVAGLVIDGGQLLAAKRRAVNEAEAAARAGAAALTSLDVDSFRSGGHVVLDPDAAETAARAYLARTGHTDAHVFVAGDRVRVTLSFPDPEMSILRFVTGEVHGSGEARAVRGVVGAET
jgi:hypothetical protein